MLFMHSLILSFRIPDNETPIERDIRKAAMREDEFRAAQRNNVGFCRGELTEENGQKKLSKSPKWVYVSVYVSFYVYVYVYVYIYFYVSVVIIYW